jgi:hypothetical protein
MSSYPVVLSAPLLSELKSVEALFRRAGFTTSAAVPGTSLPASAHSALCSVLRAKSRADAAVADADAAAGAAATDFVVLPVTSHADIPSGVVTTDEAAVVAALRAAAREACDFLGVAAALCASALVTPASLSAAREASLLLAAYAAREDAGMAALRASCSSAAAQTARLSRAGAGASRLPATATPSPTPWIAPPPSARGDARVDVDALCRFVFPPGEHHSRSVGRLVVYSLYGPLRDGQLWGGRGARRALTPREVATEVDTVERADALAAAAAGAAARGAALSEAGAAAVLAAARQDGRYELPRMSEPQVRALLAELPRDAASGDVSFHDVQGLVLAARARRVRDLQRLFPPKMPAAEARVSIAPRAPLLGRGTLAAAAAAAAAAAPAPAPDTVPFFHAKDVWRKQSDVAMRRTRVDLLNTKSQHIAAVADASSAALIPALLSNILLLREDIRGPADTWARAAPFTLGKDRGTRVPGSITRGVGLQRMV